jgi:two-component system C4-dicarboxylate transport sensor histidine kinase DctB
LGLRSRPGSWQTFGGRLTAHNAEDGAGAVFEMALPIYDPDGGRADAPLAAE